MNRVLHLLLSFGALGLLLSTVVHAASPAGRVSDELSWKVEYDDADRITAITDPAGRTTKVDYEFDEFERLRKLVRTTADGSRETRELDEQGRLVSMRDGAGAVSYGYDDLDRLNRVQREGTPAITYTHDTLDRIKTLEVGDFYRIAYEYDFLGRLASMDTPAGLVRFDYMTGQGMVVRTLPNGIKTIWEYSAEGRLRRITHGLATDPESNRYRVLVEYSYGYRPDGLIETIDERSGSGKTRRTYQYDEVGRLVRAKGLPRPQYVYGYDKVGNRTKTLSTREKQKNFRYDWAGRLRQIEGIQAKHDAAGNLTSLTIGGKTRRYRYNDENQLAEVLGGTASYRYDGDGNLIGRTVGRNENNFILDPLSNFWKPLAIEDMESERTLVVWDDRAPLMMIGAGGPEYMLHDHLGSVRIVANKHGRITKRFDYSPYGVIENSADRRDFAPRFAGLFWEPSASVYLTRARAFSPWIGSFFQIDPTVRVPFGSQQDMSIYAYCASDPVNYLDKDGADPKPAASDMPQRYDHSGQARRWFIEKLNLYEQEAFGKLGRRQWFNPYHGKKWDDLTWDQRRTIRKSAVDRFADEYADYPSHYVAWRSGGKNLEIFRKYVANMNIKTWEGWMSLDWWATVRQAKNRYDTLRRIYNTYNAINPSLQAAKMPDLSTPDLYKTGKSLHNRISPFLNIKEKPAKGNEFPSTNWLAVRMVDEVYNPRRSFDTLFSGPSGIMGTSFFSSSIPLGAAEQKAWRKSKRTDATTPSTYVNGWDTYSNYWEASSEGGPGGPAGYTNNQSSWRRIPPPADPGVRVEDRKRLEPEDDLCDPDEGCVPLTHYPFWFPPPPPGGGGGNDSPPPPPVPDLTAAPTASSNRQPQAPSPIGAIHREEPTMSPDEGIVRSTTGPGKRGGRGGGITRPPSWKPPGKQGQPHPGPQPKPGGKTKPSQKSLVERGLGLGEGRRVSSLTASPVGGVHLGGAGQALDGIGLLDGITFDENDNLILLGESVSQIKLPPLRLDDVVTIFRSVYLHGEGPTVSIDPNPKNPEGSAMIIRHGKATEHTYVGWVLFQADRLMKGYTLGANNETGKDIMTGVPGYDDVLKKLYFGGTLPQELRKEGHWERFWIVPAESNRFSGEREELTLLDVPLKVRTQSMKWESGKLVDDPQGKSSPGAVAFTGWFTDRYDQIASERYLTPPLESRIAEPVPVFSELRRISLITAIAERLRDQGTPMPFWMRDYEVAKIPLEQFTPGLEVTRASGRVIARVYGGVQLSAQDKDERDFVHGGDLSDVPPQEIASVREKLTLADSLEDAVRNTLKSAAPLEVQQFDHEGTGFQALALPGAGSRALAPLRLEEVDLSVPVANGDVIELVRSYNSFFDPKGPWGRGWALDLPRLERIPVPVRREGNKVEVTHAYELITPLNSRYARFSQIEKVPALNDSQLIVPDRLDLGRTSEFFGLTNAKPTFISVPTHKLIGKDGRAWHFDESGHLVATEVGGLRTVYEQDGEGRLTQIIGILGRQPMAYIEVSYSRDGYLESATGRRVGQDEYAVKVEYEYGEHRRLAGVRSDSGKLGYRYQGPWVTAVTFAAGDAPADESNDQVVRGFQYDARGQLLSETDAYGARTDYRVTPDANGKTVTMTRSGSASGVETISYDPSLRPLEARNADGTRASWTYPEAGGKVLVIAGEGGASLARISESADRRHRTLEVDSQYRIDSEYDDAGRMTSLAENGRTLLRQEWTPDGRLKVTTNEASAEHFEYRDDGLVSRIVLTPPNVRGEFDRWQSTGLDPEGRPVEIMDFRGQNISMGYDDVGRLTSLITRRGEKNYGYKIEHDDAGRIQRVASSWGNQNYKYAVDGSIKSLQVNKGDKSSSASWEEGLLKRIKQFDGGEVSLSYFEDGEKTGLLKGIVTPNELALAYRYDQDERLREVAIDDRARMLLDYDDESRLTGWRYTPAAR